MAGKLYCYFSNDGDLLETLSNASIRRGNSGIDSIYIYWEDAEEFDSLTVQYFMDWATPKIGNEEAAIQTVENVTVDPIKNEDPKYFKYGKKYPFIVIALPQFTGSGSAGLTVRAYLNDSTVAVLGTILFTVENAIAHQSTEITQSQYDYLMWLVEGIPNNYVPYEGAIKNIDINTRSISGSNWSIGTGGIDLEDTGITITSGDNVYRIGDDNYGSEFLYAPSNSDILVENESDYVLIGINEDGKLKLKYLVDPVNNLDAVNLGYLNTQLALKADKSDTYTKTEVDNALDLKADVTDVENIKDLIPSQASTSNQLADKDFVNSSINNIAAFYITRNADGDAFETLAQLESTTVFYSGGEVRVPTRNDYCIVRVDEEHNNATTRYTYQNGQWEFQYVVNDTPFTADQLAAINSGITSSLVNDYNTHLTDRNNPHQVTKAQVGLGNVDNTSDLNKPISTAVQNALNAKQDTLVSGTNIKTINNTSILGGGNIDIQSAVWGNITGTLSNQTDLQTELNKIVPQWFGTQAQYDALGTYDSNTVYNILES